MKIKHFAILTLAYLLVACSPVKNKHLTIFYTADEHGWFADSEKADGAAALMELWQEKENYTPDNNAYLVLSGGDNWTGASASTWFEGQSMFQVMNALGYDAAAIGNHEFDFSIDTLKARAERSSFPYLAANITTKDGKTPSFIAPYHILTANGVKVGLLGLANIETPNTTNPESVKDLAFLPYAPIVKKYVPEIKAAGADIIIILGHICKFEMEELSPLAAELGIPIITGGHCHSQVLEEKNGVLMIESEAYWRSYVKVELDYNEKNKSTEILSYEVVKNISESRNEDIEALVDRWETEANKTLEIPLAYTSSTISRKSQQMNNLIMDAWEEAFPEVDVFLTNRGSIRQDIEKGEISIADIIGLMPFNNNLVQLNVSGTNMKDFVSRLSEMNESYIWGGMDAKSTYDPEKTYQLMTNDFLYNLAETQLKKYDANAYLSGVIYREPVITWLKNQNTNPEAPLQLRKD